jgi:hypothetical protein
MRQAVRCDPGQRPELVGLAQDPGLVSEGDGGGEVQRRILGALKLALLGFQCRGEDPWRDAEICRTASIRRLEQAVLNEGVVPSQVRLGKEEAGRELRRPPVERGRAGGSRTELPGA